jgi:hypothetical protein
MPRSAARAGAAVAPLPDRPPPVEAGSRARVDQAAGLRRLFAQVSLRVLPVLVPRVHAAARSVWLARLAAAFARLQQHTLVIDAAHVQIAGALGLRARYDWLHALRGECAPNEARLDAGDGLSVLPAARALDHVRLGQATLNAILAPLAACGPRPDLVLALWPAAEVHRFAPCDVLVPVTADPRHLALALADIRSAHECADIRAFRLLFLGMDAVAAATLAHRMTEKVTSFGGSPPVAAGCARIARDLAAVAARAQTWRLAETALPMATENQA